jgi:CspA family cold shock protein
MPGDSAAANRGVALSRVGKQNRGTGREPCPLHRKCCVPGTRRQKIGEHQTAEIEEVYMTGKIRTLRVDKGFGFIKSEAGQDYFFHQTAIYGEGIADLREGDGVEFEVSDSPKGPRAVDVKRTTT